MKKAAVVIVIFALFAWAIFEVFSKSLTTLDWSALNKFSLVTFLLFACISLLNFHLFSWRWSRIIHAGKTHKTLSLIKLNLYRFVGYTVGYLTPFAQLGGEPLRIFFLEQNGIPRKEAVSSVFIDKLFEGGVQLIFAIIAIAIVITSGANLPSEHLTITMLALLGALVVVYLWMTIWGKGFFTQMFRWLQFHRFGRIAHWEEKIMHTEEVIRQFFRGYPKDLAWVCGLSLMTYVLFLGEYWIMMHSMGVYPTIRQLLIISVLPMMAYLTPIPGAVGAFEVLSIASLELAGFDGSLALPMIVMIRLRDLVFLAIGFVYASTHGIKLASKNLTKE